MHSLFWDVVICKTPNTCSCFSSLTESTVFIPRASFGIDENIGELLIPVHRSGDVSEELMVVCHTLQGTTAPPPEGTRKQSEGD